MTYTRSRAATRGIGAARQAAHAHVHAALVHDHPHLPDATTGTGTGVLDEGVLASTRPGTGLLERRSDAPACTAAALFSTHGGGSTPGRQRTSGRVAARLARDTCGGGRSR